MENTINQFLLEKVSITDTAENGNGVGRVDNLVVFVEGAVPGDVVDVHVYKKKKKYREAKVVRIIEASADRIEPVCQHFGTCGGCRWQHMSYAKQLFFKQRQVEEVLKRIGNIENPVISPILASSSQYFYRNKLDFSCSNKRWLTREELDAGIPMKEDVIGFHVPGRFDKILNIERCHLQDELSNTIRNEIKRFSIENKFQFFDVVEQEGFLRDIIFRSTSTGEWMLIVIFKDDDREKINLLLNHLKISFPEITSLLYIINPKRNATIFDLPVNVFHGRDHIFEEMEGLKFKISAKSFYQTNSRQAFELYKIARSFAALSGKELVYDLYTGTGTIANFVARKAKKVIGIDNVSDAIEDAKENSRTNSIMNTEFFSGDLNKTLTDEFILSHGKPDVIITDPPRSGMHPEAVMKMAEYSPSRIVYISCNPSTQARDIALLNEKYEVSNIQPVDMFPQTTHVENVILLNCRDENG
ncbi:MAG TPA: 23S rRNA (uracil(1939)-C(5))-methyltransferase RlmD [Bacteroidia bacterium]|nr:23S rRNA (uracil(1939)-C(5))-methyltransferase RlmD [Bacteroidia bacterium]HNS11313.1 23S rRNA (uracil(1939)-C(5))-methyltransferase RlmD [Bacteroidia bacterium]